MVRLRLSGEGLGEFGKPIVGEGGFQSLLRGIQTKINFTTGLVDVTEEELERARRYSGEYGEGGFQHRLFRAVLNAERVGGCEEE